MHDFLNQVTNTLNSIPSGTWNLLLASPILSGLLQSVKHWLDIQSDKVMVVLLTIGSGIAAAGYYILHVPTHNPSVIALQTAVVGFSTQPFYFFAVKPIYKKIAAYFDEIAQLKTAAEPATGVPLSDSAGPVGGAPQAPAVPIPVTEFAD